MVVYFLVWVQSGKGVLSAHSIGVGVPLAGYWVPSAKSAHTKGVGGGGRGMLALLSVTRAQGEGNFPARPWLGVPLAGCQANKGFKVQSGGDFSLHSRVSLTRFSQVSALETAFLTRFTQ